VSSVLRSYLPPHPCSARPSATRSTPSSRALRSAPQDAERRGHVFCITIPVCVGSMVLATAPDRTAAATSSYKRITGTREEKLRAADAWPSITDVLARPQRCWNVGGRRCSSRRIVLPPSERPGHGPSSRPTSRCSTAKRSPPSPSSPSPHRALP